MAKSAAKEPSKLLSSLTGKKAVTERPEPEKEPVREEKPVVKQEKTVEKVKEKAEITPEKPVSPVKNEDKEPQKAPEAIKREPVADIAPVNAPESTDSFSVQFDFQKSERLVKERRRSVVINSIQDKKVTSYMNHYGYSFNELMCKLIDSLPELD